MKKTKRTATILRLAKVFKKLEQGKLVNLSFTVPAITFSERVRVEWSEDMHASVFDIEPIVEYVSADNKFWDLHAKYYEEAERKITERYNNSIKEFIASCNEAASSLGEDSKTFFEDVRRVKDDLYQ